MRFLPLTHMDREEMLKVVGVKSIDGLFADVPKAVYRKGGYDLPDHGGEMAVDQALSAMADRNLHGGIAPCFLGAGAYRHHVPAAVDHLIQRGEFLTAYTPYQPEISQGTLQYLFEFQTQVAIITGMDVANASMYDGATACAEAAAMSCRITRRKKVLMSGNLHPQYQDTTQTLLRFTDIETEALGPDPMGVENLLGRVEKDIACIIVQSPGFFGNLTDYSMLAEACHQNGVLLVMAVTEPVSLGLLKSPGEMGADIVVGEGQSMGNGLNFGGPGLGLFATRDKYVRQMPGRLVGETLDADQRRGWVLTLATREQHIRREKATSNICTNSGLCALAFTIHMTLLGEAGLVRLAEINHANAVKLAGKLGDVKGVRVQSKTFFNEFTVTLPKIADVVVNELADKGVLGGVPASRFYPEYEEMEEVLLVTATECNSEAHMDALVTALKAAL